MMYPTNVYQYTLRTYYRIVERYSRLVNPTLDTTPFLDYCYDIATMEFTDEPGNHSANEYKSPEASVIIAAAERFESVLQDHLDEEEWNSLLELSWGRAPQKQVLIYYIN